MDIDSKSAPSKICGKLLSYSVSLCDQLGLNLCHSTGIGIHLLSISILLTMITVKEMPLISTSATVLVALMTLVTVLNCIGVSLLVLSTSRGVTPGLARV